MPAGWVKSLQCKQRAVNDVVESHHIRLLPASSSCRKSFQSLKDVVETKKDKPKKHKPDNINPGSRKPENITRVRSSSSNDSSNLRRHSRPPESYFPALTDLPVGHPSRNVVEIIFHTSWSPKVFSGRIEMVFKVQNSGRVVTRFEEYRELVKSGSKDNVGSGQLGFGSGPIDNVGSGQPGLREDHARCVADGNEVMRFQCLGSTAGGYESEGGDGGSWSFQWGKGAALCTYSGSGVAHESAGGGRGRKAMLVCRVIAGRVRKQNGFDSGYSGRVGYDSVSGENGQRICIRLLEASTNWLQKHPIHSWMKTRFSCPPTDVALDSQNLQHHQFWGIKDRTWHHKEARFYLSFLMPLHLKGMGHNYIF